MDNWTEFWKEAISVYGGGILFALLFVGGLAAIGSLQGCDWDEQSTGAEPISDVEFLKQENEQLQRDLDAARKMFDEMEIPVVLEFPKPGAEGHYQLNLECHVDLDPYPHRAAAMLALCPNNQAFILSDGGGIEMHEEARWAYSSEKRGGLEQPGPRPEPESDDQEESVEEGGEETGE